MSDSYKRKYTGSRGGDDRRPQSGREGKSKERASFDYRSIDSYYQNGAIRREVYLQWARDIARSFGYEDKRTSIRRLYEHVLITRLRLRGSPERAPEILQEQLGALERYAHYQKSRGVISGQVEAFVVRNCNLVGNDPQAFRGFYELFQSVMAYLPR
jgi:CRISPR/Cas system CSM-associated protein Csm2 small subunit